MTDTGPANEDTQSEPPETSASLTETTSDAENVTTRTQERIVPPPPPASGPAFNDVEIIESPLVEPNAMYLIQSERMVINDGSGPRHPTRDDFVVKDSGVRQEYESGMRRDTQEGKPRYSLLPMPMLTRWAMHMTKGAEKYGAHNWQLANSEEELDRFKDSAFRHLIQWLSGETDEDHASAILFNVAAAEHVRSKLDGETT